MKRLYSLAALTTGLIVFTSGYLIAQEKSKTATFALELVTNDIDARMYAIDSQANASKVEAFDRFARQYSQAASDKELGHQLISLTLNKYYLSKRHTESAQQSLEVMEDASLHLQLLQTAQNQRMIELLEKIAAQKK